MDLAPSETIAFWLKGYETYHFPAEVADDLQGRLDGVHRIEMTLFPGVVVKMEDGTSRVLCKASVKIL